MNVPRNFSISRHHAEWLSLVEVSGPFLSLPVLLRAFPQGLQAHDPASFANLRLNFEEWEADQESDRPDLAIHHVWIRYVLGDLLGLGPEVLREGQALPPGLEARLDVHGETLRPDLAVVNPQGVPDEGKARLLIQTWPLGQDVEKSVKGRLWNASPATRMTELLHATGVPLGLVTNGEQWMLVSAPVGETSGYASWYAPLWLEERITWQAFTGLLGVQRFFGVDDKDTLESLLQESAGDQQEVTDQLGYQVRRAVEVLVQTFDREDKNSGRTLLANVDERDIYRAALTVMMRLVFLFSAEELKLFWETNALYDDYYAASTLRAQLREAADQHGEEVLEYRRDAWTRLLATFRMIHGGVSYENLHMIAHGGHLFDPDRYPFLEGRAPGSGWQTTPAHPLPIDNRTVLHLLEALQVLEVKVPGGGPAEARLLSFRALDIEQIGHVYEGLLDHTAKRTATPVLSLRGAKFNEPEVGLGRLEALHQQGSKALLEFLKGETGRTVASLEKALAVQPSFEEMGRLRRACDNDEALLARVLPFAGLIRNDTFGNPVVIGAGSLYVTQGSDRRSSGTHYTTRSLTEPLVQRTLDPLVYAGFAEGVAASPETLRTAREILSLKVCDLAVGSASVLVQSCRYLSEKLVEAWARIEAANPGRVIVSPEGDLSTGAPEERALPREIEERLALARRLVADRCLFGVDKDPMAVEMAKLSLWMVTLQKGRPFTFLDHAIRCGDSLVGVDAAQLRTWSLERSGGSTLSLWVKEGIDQAIELRRTIERIDELDIRDVQHKERLLQSAEAAMQRAKLAGDLITAPSFQFEKPREQEEERQRLKAYYVALRTDENDTELRALADEYLNGQRPFHWPLEFPEVFFDEDGAERGFDAFVGNPPFIGGQRITGALGVPFREYLISALANGQKGSADLVAYFYLRAFGLLRAGGGFGLIATNTIAQGDTREVGLDQIARDGGCIYAANPSQKWPGQANLEVAIVHVCKGEWQAAHTLDGVEVAAITPYLTPPGSVTGNPHRLAANAGKSFQGSIVLGMGFVLEADEAQALIERDAKNRDVLFPYLNGEDLNSRPDQSPSRWVINFRDWPLNRDTAPDDYNGPVAADYPDCLAIVEEKVKPERDRLWKGDVTAQDRARRWWQFARPTMLLYATIAELPRVLVCPIFTKHMSFSWVPNGIIYMNKMYVFSLKNAFQFTYLQSELREAWARKYSGTLETRLQYAPTDCFETFPFPCSAVEQQHELERIGAAYHDHRRDICLRRQLGLTKVYNLFHDATTEGDSAAARGAEPPFGDIRRLRAMHVEMDRAVAAAYGWSDLDLGHDFHTTAQGVRFTLSDAARREVLDRLLALNHERYAEEVKLGLHEKIKGGKGKTRVKGGKKATPSKENGVPDETALTLAF